MGRRSAGVSCGTTPRCSKTYPHSADIQRHIAEHGFSHEEEFLLGLDLVLDGLEGRLEASRARHAEQ